jgi:choline kinase
VITEAIILMAGTGSRLRVGSKSLPKPLIPIGGRPLISYTLGALQQVGIATLHVVVGYESEVLLTGLAPLVPAGMRLHSIQNVEWPRQNGVSLLCAAPHLEAPFLLLMGDHLFERRLLESFVREVNPELLNLAIDRKIGSIFDLNDAMKVQTDQERVVAIGKMLTCFDAIDTGIFACPQEIFRYLERARQDDDCSLADGVRLMAGDGKVRAIDIGDAWWQDVDDHRMLAQAEEAATRLMEA